MDDAMMKLVRKQVKIIKRTRGVRHPEKVALAIEDIELNWFNRDVCMPAYAAGYLRGVAESHNISIRELLENM